MLSVILHGQLQVKQENMSSFYMLVSSDDEQIIAPSQLFPDIICTNNEGLIQLNASSSTIKLMLQWLMKHNRGENITIPVHDACLLYGLAQELKLMSLVTFACNCIASALRNPEISWAQAEQICITLSKK